MSTDSSHFVKKQADLKKYDLLDSSDVLLNERIDTIRQQYEPTKFKRIPNELDVEILLGTTTAFTAGFVSWILRGSALLTSLISTVPLFRRFDPVPILNSSKKNKELNQDSNNNTDNPVDQTEGNHEKDDSDEQKPIETIDSAL